MPAHLTKEDLEALRKWPTCAISNAIELFNIQPRNVGFMLPEIKCQFPDLGIMIGYAVPAVITADTSLTRDFRDGSSASTFPKTAFASALQPWKKAF